MENELYRLYRKNLPYVVRSEETVKKILRDPANRVIEKRESGRLIGVSVIRDSTVLLLCVEEDCRGRGIGSELLALSEEDVRSRGYEQINIGAGAEYITPGVPIRGENVTFFEKRGYVHSWGEDECFDMDMTLEGYPLSEKPDTVRDGVCYRLALPEDMERVIVCVEAAAPQFVRYYRREELYRPGGRESVLTAETDGVVCGAILIALETEGKGMGSVGCTAVHPEFQRRGVGTQMVKIGTGCLRAAGMERAHLGYTYTGLDVMYGRAGYHITEKYMMAEKRLKVD